MSLTSRLGAIDSTLGNVWLGGGSVNGSLTQSVDSVLSLSQSIVGFSGTKNVSQSFVISGAATAELVVNRSLISTFVVSQVADATRLNLANSTLTISQSATCEVTKWANDTLGLTQDAVLQYYPHKENVYSDLVLASTVSLDVLRPRSVPHTLSIAQSASGLRSRLLSASNLLVIVTQAESANVVSADNTLSLSQSVSGQKLVTLSLTQSLTFNQTNSVQSSHVLNVIDTFVFKHAFQKLSFNDEYITVPELILTKVKRRVTFRTKNRAIVLFPPELNDGEGNTGKIVLQRTINGGTYTYARRSGTGKLNYTFETDSFKALEMRRFALDCMSEPIWLENWKGEIWVGYFVNNPFELTSKGSSKPCGDRYTFNVEFEGLRIH